MMKHDAGTGVIPWHGLWLHGMVTTGARTWDSQSMRVEMDQIIHGAAGVQRQNALCADAEKRETGCD